KRSRTVTYPRKRAAQACHTCRLRRTKCDNIRPACASCVRLDAECVYKEIDPSSFDSASLAILKRMDDLESLIQSVSNAPLVVSPAAFCSTSPSSRDHSGVNAQEHRVTFLVNAEAVLRWPVFESISIQPSPYQSSAAQDDYHSPGLSIPVDLDLQSGGHFIERFFEDVHIFNPVLEEQDVIEYLGEVQRNGIGWDAKSCLMLLICALGSISTPFMNQNPVMRSCDFRQSHNFSRAESFFLNAQKRLGMLLTGNGVIEAQCFFLAGVYLMTTLRPMEAWRMFVQGLACCQALQSHDIDHAQSEAEWSPHQRIYWTCFKSELELRLELNLPRQNGVDLSYPTMFPSPPRGLETKNEPAWYFYLAEIALRRLKNRALGTLYRIDNAGQTIDREEAAMDFEEQMHAWYRSLPEALAFNLAGDVGWADAYEPFRFILKGHYLDCQEIIYWHAIVGEIGLPSRNSSDTFLAKGLQLCVNRIKHNKQGFYHRHHGTWLMIRSCTRSALVLIAASKCDDLDQQLPYGWEQAISDVTAMLSFWKEESPDVFKALQYLQLLQATN
ncbi:hypothetical protein N7452_009265, partial [Penicillium brevicompactum]